MVADGFLLSSVLSWYPSPPIFLQNTGAWDPPDCHHPSHYLSFDMPPFVWHLGTEATAYPSFEYPGRKTTFLIACKSCVTDYFFPSNKKHCMNFSATSCHLLVPLFFSSIRYQACGITSREWINRCNHSYSGYPSFLHCYSHFLRWFLGSESPWYFSLLWGPSSSLNLAFNVVATLSH